MARHFTVSSSAQVRNRHTSSTIDGLVHKHIVLLDTDTEPAVLGALEGVLEASTVYAESEQLPSGSVAPGEAAAAAKVVQRVAADKHSQVASAPAGTMVSGNPFAPGTHTPGIPEGNPLGGNPFAPAAPKPSVPDGGVHPQQADAVHVEAEIWHREQPNQPPAATPAAAAAPTTPHRVMGGIPPSAVEGASSAGPHPSSLPPQEPSQPTTGPFSSKARVEM